MQEVCGVRVHMEWTQVKRGVRPASVTQLTLPLSSISYKLKWNAHDIKLAILKRIIQWHWVHQQCGATITSIQLWKILISPPNPRSLRSGSPFTHASSPRQPPHCFLSLWISLFWTFHRMESVSFCVWLLWFIMFSRFVHVVACISTLLFFMAE